MEAVEQDPVGRRADAVLGRFHQPEPQVAWREAHVEEIARYPPLGCEQHDAAGVGVLIVLSVVTVTEADRVGELFDVRFLARQEVPALLGAWSAIALEVRLLLGRR